jgi:hypothetical protein
MWPPSRSEARSGNSRLTPEPCAAAACAKLLRQQSLHIFSIVGIVREHFGHNRRTTGRHFIDDRNIEIAVDGHRE